MNPGSPIWTQATLNAPRAEPPARCEVAIVGAGYTGLATALLLSRSGINVHVFDSEMVGAGASSRNAGFCTGNPPMPLRQVMQKGEDFARETFRWFAHAVDHAEAFCHELEVYAPSPIAFARTGTLRLAETRAQAAGFQAAAEALDRIGVTRRFIPRRELDLPSGHHFSAGLADSRSAILNPANLHLALAKAALESGAGLSEKTEVQAIETVTEAGGVVLRGENFSTSAQKVVVATNGAIGRSLVPFRDFLIPVGSFVMATAPFPETADLGLLAQGTSASTAFRFPHYFRVIEGRRLLFGGRASLSLAGDIGKCAEWLHQRAADLFPGLAIPPVVACWGGRLGFSLDKSPLLGRLDGQRYYAMGCSGHGVPTSLAMAREVACRILGDAANADMRQALPVSPFWREADAQPSRAPRIVSLCLPLVRIGYQALDSFDRTVDRLRQASMPASAIQETVH